MKIENFYEKSIIISINKAYEHIIKNLNKELKDHSCNLNQAIILISIFLENSKNITPSNLSKSLNLGKSTMSQSLGHLEKSNFLKRAIDKNDTRKFKLQLTPKGKKITIELISILDKYENNLEKLLGTKKANQFIKQIQAIS